MDDCLDWIEHAAPYIDPHENQMLKKISQKKIYVISDSVLCIGKSAMNLATEQWVAKTVEYKGWFPSLPWWHDEAEIIYDVHPGAQLHELVDAIKKNIRDNCSGDPSTYEHQIILMHMANECCAYKQFPIVKSQVELPLPVITELPHGSFFFVGSGDKKLWQFSGDKFPHFDELTEQVH